MVLANTWKFSDGTSLRRSIIEKELINKKGKTTIEINHEIFPCEIKYLYQFTQWPVGFAGKSVRLHSEHVALRRGWSSSPSQ